MAVSLRKWYGSSTQGDIIVKGDFCQIKACDTEYVMK